MFIQLDLAAADPAVSTPSYWTLWGSADGFSRSSVEQQEEQKETQEQSKTQTVWETKVLHSVL